MKNETAIIEYFCAYILHFKYTVAVETKLVLED